MENADDFLSEDFPLFFVFLGQAAVVAQLVEHPLEHVQVSGFIYSAVAMPWHYAPLPAQCRIISHSGFLCEGISN
jgi:hypothetical protein